MLILYIVLDVMARIKIQAWNQNNQQDNLSYIIAYMWVILLLLLGECRAKELVSPSILTGRSFTEKDGLHA